MSWVMHTRTEVQADTRIHHHARRLRHLQAHWYRFLVFAKYFQAKTFPKIRDELVKELRRSPG